jgi:hypothetical protein
MALADSIAPACERPRQCHYNDAIAEEGCAHVKKTDLYKNEGLKIKGAMKQAGPPGRFGSTGGALPDRREQRKLDQAAGLVPFAVKLNAELVKEIQTLAQSQQIGLNELVAELLTKGLKA